MSWFCQDRVNFWLSRERAWLGHRGYSIPSNPMGQGEQLLLRAPFGWVNGQREASAFVYFLGKFHVDWFFFCTLCHKYVAVTVCFLILLLFPVNCCYLNLWSLPFVPSISLSSALTGRQERGPVHGFNGSTKLEYIITKSQQCGTQEDKQLPTPEC